MFKHIFIPSIACNFAFAESKINIARSISMPNDWKNVAAFFKLITDILYWLKRKNKTSAYIL